MPKRTRSIVVRTIVFLLLGAIVNVLVAWIGPRFVVNGTTQVMPSTWTADRVHAAFGNSLQFETLQGFIIHTPFETTQSAMGTYNRSPGSGGYLSSGYADGWPARSLRSSALFTNSGARQTTTAVLVPLLFIGRNVLLPIEPLWPGFALNTVVYASGLFVLGGLLRTFRGHWRGLRNRCEACGYNLTGNQSGKCPECGAAAF